MRECSDEVRLGMTKLSSSRETGRPDSPERGREVKEGAMVVLVFLLLADRRGAYLGCTVGSFANAVALDVVGMGRVPLKLAIWRRHCSLPATTLSNGCGGDGKLTA